MERTVSHVGCRLTLLAGEVQRDACEQSLTEQGSHARALTT